MKNHTQIKNNIIKFNNFFLLANAIKHIGEKNIKPLYFKHFLGIFVYYDLLVYYDICILRHVTRGPHANILTVFDIYLLYGVYLIQTYYLNND